MNSSQIWEEVEGKKNFSPESEMNEATWELKSVTDSLCLKLVPFSPRQALPVCVGLLLSQI